MSMGEAAMANKLKHLEMIQGVINRLASNSFRIKGWSVVVATAVLALGTRSESFEMVLVALVPVLVFWWLDGYYLSRENLFCDLYDRVRTSAETDFSMDVSDLRKPGRFWPRDWFSAVWSTTLSPFYLTLVALVLAGAAFVCMTGGGM